MSSRTALLATRLKLAWRLELVRIPIGLTCATLGCAPLSVQTDHEHAIPPPHEYECVAWFRPIWPTHQLAVGRADAMGTTISCADEWSGGVRAGGGQLIRCEGD